MTPFSCRRKARQRIVQVIRALSIRFYSAFSPPSTTVVAFLLLSRRRLWRVYTLLYFGHSPNMKQVDYEDVISVSYKET